MILVFEMTWTGTAHAPGNSATIQTIAGAFPDQGVRILADASHLAELRRFPALMTLRNIDLRPIEVSPLFPGKTHIVSWRRFRCELASIRGALRDVAPNEPCLVMLISATPTAILAASLVSRMAGRRRVAVQVGLHGNLNEINGWRPRNPLTRRFDLASALAARRPMLRYLVLEAAIRDELARIAPEAAARTDVLPLPVNTAEMPAAPTASLAAPVRIGFVGQATNAKGFDTFLAVAADMKHRFGKRVAFHHVGRTMPGAELPDCSVLAEPLTTEHLPRSEFTRRLAALHYVLLPFREGYYALSASGSLIDAITWLKPVIATKLPLVKSFFGAHGEIGFLCESEDGLKEAVAEILTGMDEARYARQIANVEHARASRTPEALTDLYRTIVREGFPGLFG